MTTKTRTRLLFKTAALYGMDVHYREVGSVTFFTFYTTDGLLLNNRAYRLRQAEVWMSGFLGAREMDERN